MPTIRVPIWKLLALIALVAVGIASLKNPTPLRASWMFFQTVGSLLFAVMGSIVRQGSDRLPYLGFSVFGTGYLLVMTASPNLVSLPSLPLEDLLDSVRWAFVPGPIWVKMNPSDPNTSSFPNPQLLHYRHIGRSLVALVMGLIGSMLARLFRIRYAETGSPERLREMP